MEWTLTVDRLDSNLNVKFYLHLQLVGLDNI